MTDAITIHPIGIIRTPYDEPSGMPIQGRFKDDVTGRAELFPEYWDGLKDLDGFSHAILICHFNRAKEAKLRGRPFLEDEEHGIFAIRSPNRPNHIGLSVVRLLKVEDGVVVFGEVDILDETPLIDIKPYVSHFDARENVKNGWIEKHFEDGSYPKRVIRR
ncbi:MAG: tRNA (N6-threonylcarbamoyladenosine(37)-N6)-methyltransferase TrmO [Proteobacteria bacterium]|nr:tRNA (N6-threonylcarbamoyladenosine(37)-N6)-methyltransferase TrmO [Pseudomonadota bacterium]